MGYRHYTYRASRNSPTVGHRIPMSYSRLSLGLFLLLFGLLICVAPDWRYTNEVAGGLSMATAFVVLTRLLTHRGERL